MISSDFRRRVGAILIDLLILQAVMLLLGWGLNRFRIYSLHGLPQYILSAGYVCWTWRRGATPGMLIADVVGDKVYRVRAGQPNAAFEDIVFLPPTVLTAPRPIAPPLRPTITDVAYADRSPLQTLDLYLPAPGRDPAPLVIWIHGGGLRTGDKRSVRTVKSGPPPNPRSRNGPYRIQVPDVAALTASGYAVASLNYRLGGPMILAATPAIRDAKAAVRFLRSHAGQYRLDPEKFAAWGNSAGGYLAAMLGATGDQRTIFDDLPSDRAGISSAVQAVVVWFGAEDRLLLPRLDIATYLSAARHLPPFLIANGDADPVISPHQAKRLHRNLLQAGASSHLTILRGAGHEDPAFTATQMAPTFAFLDKVLGHSNQMA